MNATILIPLLLNQELNSLVTEGPQMIAFGNNKGSFSMDAFLIATAMNYGLTAFT